MAKARKQASIWHRTQKASRLKKANQDAQEIINKIDLENKYVLELALAILYLGEGSKKAEETALGSSDPLILKFFLTALKRIYNFDFNKIRCELYLRADQHSQHIKNYWAKELGLPLSNFRQVSKDKRTQGSKTYAHYKGVCNLRCGDISIKRRLLNIAQLFCEGVSS